MIKDEWLKERENSMWMFVGFPEDVDDYKNLSSVFSVVVPETNDNYTSFEGGFNQISYFYMYINEYHVEKDLFQKALKKSAGMYYNKNHRKNLYCGYFYFNIIHVCVNRTIKFPYIASPHTNIWGGDNFPEKVLSCETKRDILFGEIAFVDKLEDSDNVQVKGVSFRLHNEGNHKNCKSYQQHKNTRKYFYSNGCEVLGEDITGSLNDWDDNEY